MTTHKIDLTELPNVTNPVYYPLYNDNSRYLLLYGGAGSGKSYFAGEKLVLRTLNEKGHRFLVLRKVARTIRHSCFDLLREVISQWGLSQVFKVNKSDLQITIPGWGEILFAGLDDVEKLKSIYRITGVWIEEPTELTADDFRQINLRLRGITPYYKQIMMTFNPISALSWIKRDFFDNPKENSKIVKTTYQDNRFIDEEYKQVIESLKDQDYVYYQVYALGEWGVLGNLILTNYEVHDFPTDESWFSTIYQGMDYGFNDPSAFLKIGVKDDELYWFDELYMKGLTNSEWIQESSTKANKSRLIIADSAEPDRIKEFRQAGFRIQGAVKGKDSVRAGIDFLRRKKNHIHPNSPYVLKEMQGWKYKEDRDGNVYDEPVEINDHLMSAGRYAIEPLRRFTQPLGVDLSINRSLTRISPNIL